MKISLDPQSSTPPFDQLRRQLIDLISTGEVVAGTRLLPVRALATELGLAANTVARAYKELEAAGFIETRGRAGSFVTARQDSAEREALTAARAYARRAKELGVSRTDALAYVAAALDAADATPAATEASPAG